MIYPNNPYASFTGMQPIQQPQPMSMPIYHVDMVEVQDRAAVDRYPVAIGNDQMFILHDKSKIYVKSVTRNGTTVYSYAQESEKPADPPFVTWDAFNQLLSKLGERTAKEALE